MAAVNGLHHNHHFHIHNNHYHQHTNHAAVKQSAASSDNGQEGTKSPNNTLSVAASREHVFDQFVTACTCKSILSSFSHLLDVTGLRHADHASFYTRLKTELQGSWRAQSLWARLDKRWAHREYKAGMACSNTRVLVIGSGPCGLRTAIECALLGAKTVVVEKRDRFSRNNVLHLWPFLITDLKGLGAKKFFGKFCAGAIDHISIRQLQCILMKIALLVGVEIHVNVSFDGLIEPPDDQTTGIGWRCKTTPSDHVLSEYIFDVLVGADGKRNTLPGFNRKEFRGKLAIAITANFINRNTQAEARVEEISGVAFIFNQKFFLDLKESTRIDLENIVYYKDDTHYFVMTAKKASLLEKGVLKEDLVDTFALLDRSNVDQEALMAYAREAADFSTNYKLPSLDYANNHYGQADVAMFDFTSMFAAENASRFVVKNGHHLLMALVGDSLLEPFWPTGSGCARGFLGAFDTAWMIRSWAMGRPPLQVLAERESVYAVLSQTTPNYLHKNHNLYTIDPNSRYPNLNMKLVKPRQMIHLYEGGEIADEDLEEDDTFTSIAPPKKPRNAEVNGIDSYTLLRWCQRVLNTGKYRDVHVVDLTSSWRSGLALCALIHSFRPELINNTLLLESDVVENNKMAFQVAEKELGIPPVMSPEDMAKHEIPDKLAMVSYLSQFYELFKHELLPSSMPLPVKAKRKSTSGKETSSVKQPKSPHSPNRRTSFLQKLSARLAKSKKRKEQEMNEGSPLGSKKFKEKQEKSTVELTNYSKLPMEEIANRLQLDRSTDVKVNKTEERSGAVSVTAMADLLVAKFKSNQEQPPPEPIRRLKGTPSLLAASSASEFCTFCHKRVYLMERMSAEGAFFHRQCLKCDHCGVGLRLTNYTCDREAKPVKFFCYRHALPEMRLRPARKRGLEDEEDTKENVPEMVVTPAPDVNENKASREKSPRKAAADLSPLALPVDIADKPTKTPERVEFEISFDGAEEESEEEQFEHNLRASLSSDALLDEESSSESDSECFESEEEDAEVWENAVESLSPSGLPTSPLTLEEACEFVSSWRRQHSREDLVTPEWEDSGGGEKEQNEKDKRKRKLYGRQEASGYTRFDQTNGHHAADGEEEDDEDEEEEEEDELDDDDEEDEESSTEVEGVSEYETESSSEDEVPGKLASIKSGSHRQDVSPAKTPVSPVSRLSASKASFFSVAPTPVSLDPLSMFGINSGEQKEEEKDEVQEKEEEEEEKKKSSTANKKKGKKKRTLKKNVILSEKEKPGSRDESPKSTDVSESLDLDPKSPDLRSQRVAQTGSLAELREAFAADKWAEVDIEDQDEIIGSHNARVGEPEQLFQLERKTCQQDKSRSQSVGSNSSVSASSVVEPKKPQSILKRPSIDFGIKREGMGDRLPVETGSDDGDDERGEGEDEDEEMLEKTAVSKAMEQLLHDFDHKGAEVTSATNHAHNETSDSGENEVFIEGRLSPSGLKTRKFRLKRQSRRSKGEQRRISKSGTSDSEAGRTDPTTTDNSQLRSSISRSPSVEVQLTVAQTDTTSGRHLAVETIDQAESSGALNMVSEQVAEPQQSVQVGEITDLKDVKEETGQSLSDMVTGTGDDTLQQVLESVAAMPELSDNSDIDDVVIANIDDKFVTDRRGRTKNKTKKVKMNKKKKKTEEADKIFRAADDVHSSFSISTPSGSESSVSSVMEDELTGHILNIEPGDDDIKPDADMLKDYTTTMSLALGESYSDVEESGAKDTSKHNKIDHLTQNQVASIHPSQTKVDVGCVENEVTNLLCNNENEGKPGNNDSSATGNSSVYLTPNSSVNEHHAGNCTEDSSSKSPVTRRPLPIPNLSETPVPQPRRSLASPQSPTNCMAPSSHTNSLSQTPVHSTHDSSGSDMFVSPVENLPEPPFVNTPTETSPSSRLAQSKSASLSTSKLGKAGIKTKTGPTPNALSSLATNKSNKSSVTLEKDNNSISDPSKRPQRKLPELPKLNVLNKKPLQSAVRTSDQPVMCSSPRLAKKQEKFQPSSSTQSKVSSSRPLPIPKSSTSDSKTSETATSKPPQSPFSSPSVSRVHVSGKPTFSDAPSFTKPVSKPVFKPPAKTKVAIDKSKLKLGSSSEKTESDVELDKKKKISADGIFIPKSPEDDIPFADESGAEEQFYTPCATGKKERPTFPVNLQNLQARKRILPSPPTASAGESTGALPPSPNILNAGQIREIRQAEMERAKLQARERARLKSDEELGLVRVGSTGSSHATPVRGTLQQKLTPQPRQGHQRNASYDTVSTSDVLSDSDDNKLLETAPNKENTMDSSSLTPNNAEDKKSKKKKKPKTPKGRKAKKDDAKETESDKKEKRKSLLALILPAKSSEKSQGQVSSGNSTPKGSDDNLIDGSNSSKSKKNKAKKESKDRKGKSVSSRDDSHKTSTAEINKDLAICSVFHTEATKRPARSGVGVDGGMKTIPLAPKASGDEFSDSDESHVSFSTMQKRRDEDLDERVARRLRKIQLKQQRQAQQKRLRMAQEIQRQLEEVEVRQRDLETRGIAVEKALRGDGPEEEDVDESALMSEWFTLVHEKNALLRYESELNVRAKELELEDRQARLELDFRERSRLPESSKTESEIAAEGKLLDELLDVVEQRNNLVAMLEEDRVREQKEDKDLKDMMHQKGFTLSPLSFDTRRERQRIEAPLASMAL
ncbi:[F-actin]-methionine sulfoxide oxidase mical3 [Plakobranchus ocellatus]|uniref:F-actin monooxygenase n=1 Tax=Plakobranchus ocellatus TaxID=259542 RepID=A0AAV3YDF1_9GAST|nr:[F-actin]-methionine sulfoxide oxidase mical3 [Plakobranchus ocellatus]